MEFYNKNKLEEFGGHISLSQHWAQSLLKFVLANGPIGPQTNQLKNFIGVSSSNYSEEVMKQTEGEDIESMELQPIVMSMVSSAQKLLEHWIPEEE